MSDNAKEIQPWRVFVGEEPVNADFRPRTSTATSVATNSNEPVLPQSDASSDLIELEVTEPPDPATDTLKSETLKAPAKD